MDKETMEFEANFSVLERYGTDVTKDEYVTDPAIGRDQQIKELILVLLTPEKSAILIGKPGIGKTAIVEGLAYRIQQNNVPDALQGYTILNIKTASLLGTMPSGESKVQKMIDELKTKEKIILFIDEIHMLIGSTETSSLDFANIFKEGLGRGSIKVIGATTTEEYERYILRDKAFTRRFQKIEVPEPSRDETIAIMMGTLPKFEKQTGRKMKYTSFIQERIMSFIVDITSEYKRIFSLGSRYPDVCLTLLKQAFSYTVYDNRPYMDIFDVRKAIENSKNIYPDVIKKELPNFDKMFNDIMLEEKGEKPIEEWRKDGTLTRSELENNEEDDGDEESHEELKIKNNEVYNNRMKKRKEEEEFQNKMSLFESDPDMIDKVELRNSKPINNIITSTGKTKYAKVGSAAVSTGLKEKINKTVDSSKLDDMILSSNVGVLKNEAPKQKQVIDYVVTDEIRPGVDDGFLLGRPIGSNAEIEEQNIEYVPEKYRGNQKNKKNEGKRMWNNDFKPERQDISNQNFDKYQNYFHPENNANNNEDRNRIDMLMSGSSVANSNTGGNYNMNNQMQGPMNMPMNDQVFGGPMQGPINMPMNDQMYGGAMQGPMNPPMNDQMFGGAMQGPMNPPMNDQMFGGPMQGPMNPPMNDQMYGGPMQGPMNPPMNDQMYGGPMQGPMNQQMNNQSFSGPMNSEIPTNNQPTGSFFNNSSSNNGGETLFGAPMYGESSKDENSETLFGAPMYSVDQDKQNNDNNSTGIIDNDMIIDNMSIKNGEIVNEFPTFEKLNNLSAITNSAAALSNEGNNQNQQFNPTGFGINNNPAGFGINNNPTGFGIQNNSNMGMNSNKNWTFIDNQSNNNQQNMTNNSSFFQKNILDDVQKNKEENNITTNGNITSPTNNKDYYEDMKSGNFVNFSDLNQGKVKEEETNKYMGVQTEENKPQFDLNLENGAEEDNKFDDFYE